MVEIRLLKEDDTRTYMGTLLRLMEMVLKENIDQVISSKMVYEYITNMKKFMEDGTAIVIGAFDNENLVGFHWGYVLQNISEKRIHSNFVVIDNEYRRQGIGSRFFACLEQEAKRRNIYIIEAMCTYINKNAVDYHLHNGFEIERLKVKKVLRHVN